MNIENPSVTPYNSAGTEIGTAAAPVRVDPTGSTAQPVSGSVTANIGTSGSLALDATLTGGTQKAIVRGGAKGATAAADATTTAEGADHQAVDVQIMHGGAAKDPTQIRSLTAGTDAVTVSGTATVSGTVTANIGTSGSLALDATLTGGTAKSIVRGAAKGATAAADATTTAEGADHQALDVQIMGGGVAAGVDAQNHQYVAGKSATGVAPSSNPVSVSGVDGGGLKRSFLTDTAGRVTIAPKAGTSSVTSVASSATNVTILAANASRLGASIQNDSTQILYLKLGATASATSYTVRMVSQAHYEVPFGYTGIIDGIWVSANGSARVTELT
jgi:hypothetical protein